MSVINQMLRDLDKRQQPQSQATPRMAPTPMRSSNRLLLWAAVVMAVAALYGWSTQNRSSAKPSLQPTTNSSPIAATSQPAMTSAVPASSRTEPAVSAAEARVAASQLSDEHVNTTSTSSRVATASTVASTIPADSASLNGAKSAEPADPSDKPLAEAKHAEATTSLTTETDTDATWLAAQPLANPSDATLATTDNNGPMAVLTSTPPPMQVQPSLRIEPVLDPEAAQRRLQSSAVQAMANGEYGQAVTLYQQIIQAEPHHTAAYEQLAQLYLQLGDYARLTALHEQALQQGLQSPTLAWHYLQSYVQRGNWPLVLQLLTPELQAQYPAASLALETHAAAQTKDQTRSLQASQRWTVLQPNEGRAWLGQALALEQLGQKSAAILSYQQALACQNLAPASVQFIQQRLAQGI